MCVIVSLQVVLLVKISVIEKVAKVVEEIRVDSLVIGR
jgi:hypothetical protein